MKTCGMMGEVVGKAASICVARECLPRDVYEQYLGELKELLTLPGQARRETVGGPLKMPANLPVARAEGPPSGLDPASFVGQLMDDRAAAQGRGLDGRRRDLKGISATAMCTRVTTPRRRSSLNRR